MDPLTIATGTITLIQTVIAITSTIATFTEDVHDANADLNNIRQELGNLSLVLESLAKHTNKWEREAQSSDPLVRRILEVIQDCEKLIEELSGLIKKYDSGMRRRIAWAIYGKNNVEKLSIRLQANNRMLSFSLEIVNSVTTHEIKADTAVMRREAEATREEFADMRAQINRLMEDLQRRGEPSRGLNVQLWVDEVSDYAESHIGFSSDEVASSSRDNATGPESLHPRNANLSSEKSENTNEEKFSRLKGSGNADELLDGSSRSSATRTPQASTSLQRPLSPKSARLQDYEIKLDSIIDRLLEVRGSRPGKQVQLLAEEIRFLCVKAREIFISQPVLLELEPPIKVFGTICGQYYDLLRMFELGGWPPNANYLLLGNYVNKGEQSLETICLLFAFKIKYPENFFLLRGNHECSEMTRTYGFYDECKRRYNIQLWKTFSDCFNCLPLAAIIDEKIFCIHGGLSPDLNDIRHIRRIQRPIEIPSCGLIFDLLWSDPDKDIIGWGENDRGISFTFGPDVVSRFLQKHDLGLIVRSHQVVEGGYEFFSKQQLITVFAAPNYCGLDDDNCYLPNAAVELALHLIVYRSEGPVVGNELRKELVKQNFEAVTGNTCLGALALSYPTIDAGIPSLATRVSTTSRYAAFDYCLSTYPPTAHPVLARGFDRMTAGGKLLWNDGFTFPNDVVDLRSSFFEHIAPSER